MEGLRDVASVERTNLSQWGVDKGEHQQMAKNITIRFLSGAWLELDECSRPESLKSKGLGVPIAGWVHVFQSNPIWGENSLLKKYHHSNYKKRVLKNGCLITHSRCVWRTECN